jgi:hypothetical protein
MITPTSSLALCGARFGTFGAVLCCPVLCCECLPLICFLFGSWENEIARWQLPRDKWRVDWKLNANYELCPTYPSTLIFPATISTYDVAKAAPFRSKHRLPVLTWYNKRSGNCLIRCAQPHVGVHGNTSTSDEQLIRAFRMATPRNDRLTIVDARSRTAAVGNQIKGEGTEDVKRYDGVKQLFMVCRQPCAVVGPLPFLILPPSLLRCFDTYIRI